MDFKHYQDRMVRLKVYPDEYKILYPALKLSGEAGEVSEKIGKLLRDKFGAVSSEDKSEIKKELGDVLWYINALATDLDIELEDVAQTNINKLEKRKQQNKLHGSGDNR